MDQLQGYDRHTLRVAMFQRYNFILFDKIISGKQILQLYIIMLFPIYFFDIVPWLLFHVAK